MRCSAASRARASRSSPPRPGPVRTDNGMLTLLAERSLDELAAAGDRARPGRPRRGRRSAPAAACSSGCAQADETSTWTTSVCTGSLILAAAGLLEGRRATSHWLALEELRRAAAPSRSPSASSSTASSSPPRASRPGSTWRSTLAARIAGEHGRPGDPAGHRVRPAAAVRRRLAAARRRRRSSSCCAAAAASRRRTQTRSHAAE